MTNTAHLHEHSESTMKFGPLFGEDITENDSEPPPSTVVGHNADQELTENCRGVEAKLTKLTELTPPRLRTLTSEDEAILEPMPVGIRNFARTLSEVYCQPALFVLTAILGAVSCAVAELFTVSRKGFSAKNANIFCLMIGRPGNHKTTLVNAATAPHRAYAAEKKEQYEQELDVYRYQMELYNDRLKVLKRAELAEGSTAERRAELTKLIDSKPKHPRNPHPWGSDMSVESWAMNAAKNGGFWGAVDSEAAQTINQIVNGLSGGADPKSFINAGWDCGEYHQGRVTRSDIHIQKLITPMLLATQPEQGPVIAKGIGSGLTARFLVATTHEPHSPPSGVAPCPHATRIYADVITELLENRTPVHFPLSEEAEELFYYIDEINSQNIRDNVASKPEGWDSWEDKSSQQALRVAGVLRAFKWGEGDPQRVITLEDAQAAYVFVRKSAECVEELYDSVALPQVEQDAAQVMKWLSTKSHREQIINRRIVRDGFNQLWISRSDMPGVDRYWRRIPTRGGERKDRLRDAFEYLVETGEMDIVDAEGPTLYQLRRRSL